MTWIKWVIEYASENRTQRNKLKIWHSSLNHYVKNIITRLQDDTHHEDNAKDCNVTLALTINLRWYPSVPS